MSDRKCILVIDDQDDIREIAALSLESGADWSVLSASSGRRGLEIAAQEKPDAILLDVMMPVMDGQETLALLRADESTREIPVLFLTAKANVTSTTNGAAELPQGVILKPFDPLTLAEQVADALGWSIKTNQAVSSQS